MIWFKEISFEELQSGFYVAMAKHLDIQLTAVGNDFISASMPVDERTQQPYGILHGGASVVLAETLGSFGGYLCVNPEISRVVGLEINANHIRPVSKGRVTGTAKPLHLGNKSHVWEIRIEDEEQKLVCISRITLAVIAI